MTRSARILLLLALVAAFPVFAHSLSLSYLDIRERPDGQLHVELDVPLRDLALAIPVDRDGDLTITWAELLASEDALKALVERDLAISRGGVPCRTELAQLGTRRYGSDVHAGMIFAARCNASGAVAANYRLFVDRDPLHRSMVTIRDANGSMTAIASASRLVVSSGGEGASSSFTAFVREGVHHILIGYDHLAFLALLLLPVVLRRSKNGWQPVDRFKPAFVQAAGIVTAFTVAHSLTLTSAVLGWITPSPRWTEVTIAASVLLAALNNIWPVVTKRLFVLAFVFGLVHGFGFAGVLSDVGLPADGRVRSLLGFNLGVEAGQLAVVAGLLPLLFLARERSWYPAIGVRLASAAVGALAIWWIFERLS